ncbi:pyridoxine/pyridoxamine 5'-phosphate oxidase-like [Homalodisca vitripennis]|uniref:pyridoxine/pyridoxamine 5'-phosphate oxidase-like n=1 Tax=Homalodisca vitripennis TaxID=197043 RepID=UPI001EEB30F2|nr:pyridoxine/pyridoxamine 5'-phosphate oxidase-like [Homalodisca vitripennis]
MGQENGLNDKNAQNGSDKAETESGLARIEFSGSNPFQLFREWHGEAREVNLVSPDALCFSTCSKDGVPSSRHMLLRRLDDDGFVLMTDGRSRKSNEIAENPLGSLAFLWSFRKDGSIINRQVRIDGRVEDLPQSSCQEIWEREPLYCKIRANICDQGRPVDWEDHKRIHDSWYEECLRENTVPTIPDHVVYYKVIPTFMEFYLAHDNFIGDRLAFHCTDKDAKVWKMGRIAA